MKNSETTICPICESSRFDERHKAESFKYKSRIFELDAIEYSKCVKCVFELVTPRQLKKNESRIKDQYRRIDGLLTGEEIRKIREKYKLTQEAAAIIFGGGANAFSKYERGEVIQSTSMDRLLRSVREDERMFEIILEKSGFSKARTFAKKRSTGYVVVSTELRTESYSNIVTISSRKKGRKVEATTADISRTVAA